MKVWCLIERVTSDHDNTWWSIGAAGIYVVQETKPTYDDTVNALLQLGFQHFNRFTGKNDNISIRAENCYAWVECAALGEVLK